MFQKVLSLLPILGALQSNSNDLVTLPGYGSFSGITVTQTLSGYDLTEPVKSWLGIEYSTQPIGAGRFAPPSNPLEFSGVLNATRYGKVCPQEERWFNYPELITMGEDCLTMNIFRPEGVSMRKKLPIFVWIHGGGFAYGSVWDFDGPTFVASSREPLMVITFNYRLNSLGSLPSKLFSDGGLLNLGLQDQRQLLKFVRKYMTYFGGNPNRVTVGGLSAGAHSAGFHYQNMEEGKPLLSQAIFQSGGPATRAFPNYSYPLYAQHFKEFIGGVGCGKAKKNDTVLECLRSVDIAVIQKVSDRMAQVAEHNVTWPFQPVSEAPLIPQLPSRSWKEGKFNKIPVLTSFTSNEGNFYAPEDLSTNAEALKWMHTIAPGLDEIDLQILTELYLDPVTEPLSQYTNSPLSPQYDRLGAIYSDYSYICAAQENAISVAAAGVPVWKMHFNTNNSRPYYRGIDHATDRTYVWNEPAVQHPSVAADLHSYWASFVVSGDPNSYRKRGAAFWPKYDAGGTQLGVQLRMDYNRSVVEKDAIRRAACDFWRARHEKLTR